MTLLTSIASITINGLYGLFDHHINLNLESHVTIIYGPNGVGKTTILKFIKAIFNKSDEILFTIPFKEIKVTFSNESVLSIKRTTKKDKNHPQLNYQLFRNINDAKPLQFNHLNEAKPRSIFFRTDSNVNLLSDKDERVQLNFEDVFGTIDANELILSERHFSADKRETIKKLNIVRKLAKVHLIETQRLINFKQQTPDSKGNKITQVVMTYSENLAKAIREKLAESASRSQALDRTFPMRLLSLRETNNLSTDKILERLSMLEQKLLNLTAAGLLDQDNDVLNQPTTIDDETRKVLSVYIDDAEKKLEIFDQLAEKIEIMKRIINERFLYKNLSINKDTGFVFTTTTGEVISPEDLSSGEQHELVLLYELLFNVEENSFILIDEPELSLHIAWQKQFITDIQEIASIRNFNVLIATHSPQIIHNRWDLAVGLGGDTND